ncbi:MAG: hypothetical protein GDA41_01480 [Rhodospirillales bacterium]|nr:hypothetical protein [Rhodospirillales bacterium]
MFVAEETLGIFPTLVFRTQALGPEIRPLTAAAQAALTAAAGPAANGQAKAPPGPRRRSPPALQAEPAFRGLVQSIAALAAEALRLAAFERPDCTVTALWAEAAPAAWAEPIAQAPNAHLTFVLPLRAAAGFGVLLTDPRPQAQVIVPMVSAPNRLNARQATLALEPGQLLLLPGWQPHAVQGGGGTGEILLLRGQTLFRNMAEKVSPPMWTGMTANRNRT